MLMAARRMEIIIWVDPTDDKSDIEELTMEGREATCFCKSIHGNDILPSVNATGEDVSSLWMMSVALCWNHYD